MDGFEIDVRAALKSMESHRLDISGLKRFVKEFRNVKDISQKIEKVF